MEEAYEEHLKELKAAEEKQQEESRIEAARILAEIEANKIIEDKKPKTKSVNKWKTGVQIKLGEPTYQNFKPQTKPKIL